MYMHEKATGQEQIDALESRMLTSHKAGIDPALWSRSATVEVWCTGMQDAGEYTELRFFGSVGAPIGTHRINGY